MTEEEERKYSPDREKIFRWTISILLILYTSIAIFVTVVTLMDSVKTRGDLLKSFIAIPSSITFEAYKRCSLKMTLSGILETA